MKKTPKIKIIILLLSAIALASFSVPSAACSEKYTPVYATETCSVEITEPNSLQKVACDKKYVTGDFIAYFGADVAAPETIDFMIENCIKAYSALKSNRLIASKFDVVVSDEFVAKAFPSETTGLTVSLPTVTSLEEITAWFLSANDVESDLPFGVYAGTAAQITNSPLLSGFIAADIEASPFVTDLQFPLYETGNLTDKQRKIAFGFAGRLITDLIENGKTYADILSMNKADISAFLSGKYSVALPEYAFEPYSKKYEYKVRQGVFTYYINREFNDLILPINVFSTSYDRLSDWLKDNETTTAASNSVFKVGSMYNIDVFLDDGFKSNGISGYADDDFISIYSAGSFSHEYVHHILFRLGKSGNAREVIPELHANSSVYSRAMWYYLLTGKAENFPYDKKSDEKQSYLTALNLYEKLASADAAPDNFDFWLFADCFSAVHTKKGTPFISRLQPDSLAYYVARVYGAEYVWKLNTDTQILIDGKPYADIIDEWLAYVQSLNE